MCGGFKCSKNTLIALNIFYVLVGILLIFAGVYGKKATGITSLPVISGIVVCGVILIIFAIIGLIGAVKHHQVILFFYMIFLFILFIIQFSIACSCLAVDTPEQKHFAENGWLSVSDDVKQQIQHKFDCCGFNSTTLGDHPPCNDLPCCMNGGNSSGGVKKNETTTLAPVCDKCEACLPKLTATIDHSFRLAGTMGLLFSFTEFFGVWLTVRYRNQKDPRGNPSAFL